MIRGKSANDTATVFPDSSTRKHDAPFLGPPIRLPLKFRRSMLAFHAQRCFIILIERNALARFLNPIQTMKIVLLAAVLSFISTSGAAVIQNDAMLITSGTPPYFFPFGLTFTVNSAPFLVIEVIKSNPNTFTFQYQGIADAYSLFQITAGTNFDASFVNSHSAFVNNWNAPGQGILTLPPGQSVYLAYWDQGSGPPRLVAEDADLFGWARLTNASGKLIVSESATAMGGGIKSGTLEQIPEPTAPMILGVFGFLAASRRIRTAKLKARIHSESVRKISRRKNG